MSAKRKPLDAKIADAVKERDHHMCQKCTRTDNVQVHHIKARVDGGADDLDNLTLLCISCHEEWHMIEEATTIPFQEWLELPTAVLLVLAWHALTRTEEALDATVREFKKGIDLLSYERARKWHGE